MTAIVCEHDHIRGNPCVPRNQGIVNIWRKIVEEAKVTVSSYLRISVILYFVFLLNMKCYFITECSLQLL